MLEIIDAIVQAINDEPLAIIIGILSIIGAILVRKTYKTNAKEKQFGSRLGLKPISKKEFLKYIDKSRFSLLSSKIAPAHIAKIQQGKHEEYNVCLFFLGLADGSLGGGQQTAVYIRNDSIEFPKFLLKPKRSGIMWSNIFGSKDMRFPDNPVFSDKYQLIDENEDNTKNMFNKNVINFFEQNEGITFEANGNEVIIFKMLDVAKPEQYRNHIERAIGLIKLFETGKAETIPSTLFTEQESPKQKASKLMKAAKANFGANAIIIAMLYYFFEGAVPHITSLIIVAESFGFFLYARWKMKTATEASSRTRQRIR